MVNLLDTHISATIPHHSLLPSYSCTHTSTSGGSWWKVQLDQEYEIEEVVLWNRADCCNSRIIGAKVYVGTNGGSWVLCGTVSSCGRTITVSCGKAGDSVMVTQPKTYLPLTLCEVQVMAQEETPSESVEE